MDEPIDSNAGFHFDPIAFMQSNPNPKIVDFRLEEDVLGEWAVTGSEI